MLLSLLLACPPESEKNNVESTPPVDSEVDSQDSQPPDGPVGALIDVNLLGKVGVRLTDLPVAMREHMQTEVLSQDSGFWLDRAAFQMELVDQNLYYRGYADPNRGSLPLPPTDVWELALSGPAYYDATEDAVVQEFSFHTVLVTSEESPLHADPFLASVGGILEESILVTLDPVAQYQSYYYISPTAKAVAPGTRVPPPAPGTSLSLTVYFERLPWNSATAQQYNVGEIFEGIPQLRVMPEGLENHYIEWVYVPERSCVVSEACVTGTGWRRLLRFDASVHNQGTEPLHIGFVGNREDLYTQYNIFVYSECHEHYHFSYYGDFNLRTEATVEGDKKAFCLISTSRRSNNITSELTTPYEGCSYQGIAAGWGDDYSAYLDCQWIDITDAAIPAEGVRAPLEFTFNPDHFLCEGELHLDDQGNPTFSPSEYTTEDGQTVDRPDCTPAPGVDDDNFASKELNIEATGATVTEACGIPMLGGSRNCGYDLLGTFACTPGEQVELRCTAAEPLAIRVCEGSSLRGSLDCPQNVALADGTVEEELNFSLLCPRRRGDGEEGGLLTVLTAPIWSPEGTPSVACELR